MEVQQILDAGDFDFESIVLRRSDPDDCDQIINLVEIGKDDVYNRVYSYPKVLKLIETAYLAITVLDREGRVVAFAAFEDFPQGMRGMYDEKHYNCWENWFKKAFGVEEFSTFNTLWLTYFISGGSISYTDQRFAFKKILQTVYTSLPDLIGVLFLVRGDADEEDINYCFEPVRDYFEELSCRDRDVLKEVRGIHAGSHAYFSSRVLVLPYVEVRDAKQEDHDDLADVFNSQSETVTEAYGEYFIAELIAAQSKNNRALVAQVKDKAVGLMGLTSEVDVKLLHQCFELDSFDNLLKPEFMNAIRKRRQALLEEKKKKAIAERFEELRRLKEETMKCNIISQRIQLQEYLLQVESTLTKAIEEKINGEDEVLKTIDRKHVEEFLDETLREYRLTQPSNYFLPDQHPTDDFDLVSNALSEKEFLIQTLEIFGLPQNYMTGAGHFADWGKDSNDRAAAAKKRALATKQKAKKVNAAVAKLQKERGLNKQEETDKKPTHFDLAPFLKALRRYLACNGETRSRLRMDLRDNLTTIKRIFIDEYGEQSYKKCVNIQEFGKLLQQKGISLESKIVENIGAILICFGDIQFEVKPTYRMPEETEEEKRAAALKKIKEEEEKKAALEGVDPSKAKKPPKKEEKKGEEEEKKDEAAKPEQKKEPPKPIKLWQYLTSIYDFINSIEKMHEYDFILNEMGMMTFDLSLEKEKIQKAKLGGDKQKTQAKGISLPDLGRPSTSMSGRQEANEAYSEDPHYNGIVKDLNDFETIPEPPEKAKNAFAITLFCMEAAFDSRSKDFLKHAFDRFPDRDYLIVTQPHTVSENSLLQKFTLVAKKPENTFSHVLYIIHRDSLFEEDLEVRRTTATDIEQIRELLEVTEDRNGLMEKFYESTINPDSPNLSFVCKIYNDVVGAFLLAKDVNLEYYKSHFHIQDAILLNEHERKAHTRLIFSIINPIFERSTRFILKELMRLSANTCLYFEIHDQTVIPTIFNELVHVRSRRFPHFLDRKWDHERYVPPQQQNGGETLHIDGKDRDPQDEVESTFALCFSTKRVLSEPKIVKNSRIVVVGASDTGISFIEALLSISYLQFTNIVLIAPGGLSHNHVGEKRNHNLKAQSTSYTAQEQKRLMLETRVRVINARMVDIDRSDKNIILDDDNKIIPYDTLVLAMGLQDKTLPSMGYVSRGIAPVSSDKRHVEGVLSIDDPKLYDHLRLGGTLMNALTNRRRPQNCVVYGRSLSAYTCIKGLLARGMRAEQITLVIPKETCHLSAQYDEEQQEDMVADLPFINPEAFEDEYIASKIQRVLEKKGVRVVRNAMLMQIIEDDEQQLESTLFKLLDIPDEEEDEDEIEGLDDDQQNQNEDRDSKLSSAQQHNQDGESVENVDGNNTASGENKSQNQEGEQVVQKKRRKKNELELQCRVLITAGHKDVDDDVFNAIHNNGLVYNGRLIVDKNFQTTDPSIFAAGPLCEFSGRYKAIAQGRPLRMDRYNGREMGSRLARCVFDIYDPSSANNAGDGGVDELPTFYLPQGEGGVVPGDIIYYHIKTTNPLFTRDGANTVIVKNRGDLLCDNLSDETLKGHFIKFSFNSIGLIDSVTFMGSEDVILQSLWSFVGLHENYLNSLTSRFEKGIIPNVAEFLSENWAIALYHEWFGDFCLRMRQSIQGLRDVQAILERAFESTKSGEGITRDQFRDLRKLLDPKTVKMIEDETLEFIKVNMNHLPMYYVPGEEFA